MFNAQMVNIEPDYNVSVQDFKDQTLFVRACRDVLASTTHEYYISYRDTQPVQAILLSQSVYDGLLENLDADSSLAPLVSSIQINSVSAAVRFEEVFHLVTGDSEFPGSTPSTVSRTHRKDYSGLERKIVSEGATDRFETETVEAASGGVVQVQYPISSTLSIAARDISGPLEVAGSGQTAELELQDITYTSVVGAETANNITVQYLDYTPAQYAILDLPDIQFKAVDAGTAGNSITIALTSGATLGEEVVTVTDDAISVQIAVGQTSAALLANVLSESDDAMALIQVPVVINPANAQEALSATNLAGGAAALGLAGSEIVSVSGQDITVQLESGVSTATQVLAKINASATAGALITAAITGTGSNAQVTAGPLNLSGGQDVTSLLQLGQVALTNNGSEISEGTSVEISYSTNQYVIYEVDVKTGTVVVASAALINYLIANQAS